MGGRARVTKAEGHGESERYQVQYVVGGGGEKNLPLTALTVVPEGPDEARPASRYRPPFNRSPHVSTKQWWTLTTWLFNVTAPSSNVWPTATRRTKSLGAD